MFHKECKIRVSSGTLIDRMKLRYLMHRVRTEAGDPGVEEHREVLYWPAGRGDNVLKTSALYDLDGAMIDAASLRRGYGEGKVVTLTPKQIKRDRAYPRVPKGEYVYFGPVIDHYGHFLTESIARAWCLAKHLGMRSRLVFHGDGNTLRVPYIREYFDLLGIALDRLVTFDQPVIIPEILIPRPSIRNRGTIFKAHLWSTQSIAEKCMAGLNKHRSSIPVYLARSALRRESRRVINEEKLIKKLSSHKCEIIVPENLSFCAQIRLFNSRSTFIGPLGSAHHSTLFSLEPVHHFYFSDTLYPTYVMIDVIKRNSADYLKLIYREHGDTMKDDVVLRYEVAYSRLRELGVLS